MDGPNLLRKLHKNNNAHQSGMKKVALDVSELSLTFDRAHAIVRGVVFLFFFVVTADHDATP
jgi:hypothetical protein